MLVWDGVVLGVRRRYAHPRCMNADATPQTPPQTWLDALERSEADIAAERTAFRNGATKNSYKTVRGL